MDKRFKEVASSKTAKADEAMIAAMNNMSISTKKGLDLRAASLNAGGYSPATFEGEKAAPPPPTTSTPPEPKPVAKRSKSASSSSGTTTKRVSLPKDMTKAVGDYRTKRKIMKYKRLCEEEGINLPNFDFDKMDPTEACDLLEELLQDEASIPLTENAIIGATSILERFVMTTKLGQRSGLRISGLTEDVQEAVKSTMARDVRILSIKHDFAGKVPTEGRVVASVAMLAKDRHAYNLQLRAQMEVPEDAFDQPISD